MSLNNQFLGQVAEFVKIAIDLNEHQQDELLSLKKQAMITELNRDRFRMALQKTADALYSSDFLTDESEKRTFINKSAEDPIYVAKFLEKVCQAQDVATIGRPARVTSRYSKQAEVDPVWEKAFGGGAGRDIIDD